MEHNFSKKCIFRDSKSDISNENTASPNENVFIDFFSPYQRNFFGSANNSNLKIESNSPDFKVSSDGKTNHKLITIQLK
ncbi:hypothetical protein [Flavobacterium sp. ov086]|uniref:hypothetical protein n=1 Tax=Flavobacterium sp. ov086 TaxID=1761785 RepID=UPI000B799F84|nr:hypothetical protein [Flavobacterium sp. ov086]